MLPQLLKHTTKSILHFFMKRSEEQIKRQIDAHDIISFDVFDTLIERKCGRPENVFRILQEQLNDEGFMRRRIIAERKARVLTSKEDVTLDDIYQMYESASEDQRNQYQQAELACEKEQSIIQPKGKRLYDAAIQAGKTVLIISDMYLPSGFIEEMLNQSGYVGYKRLYVSSECGLRKKTGRLYQLVREELNMNPNNWLHIGDDVITDWRGAKRARLQGVII